MPQQARCFSEGVLVLMRSDTRKALLSQALLDQLSASSTDQISVSSITKACGLSRQSFYYHFHDLHELYAWTLHHELLKIVQPVRDEGWQAQMQALLERMCEKRPLVERIVQGNGSPDMDALLKNEFGIHIMRAVEESAAGLDILPSDRALIARFYTAGLVEIIKIWVDGGMRETPERLAHRLGIFIVSSSELLDNFNRSR